MESCRGQLFNQPPFLGFDTEKKGKLGQVLIKTPSLCRLKGHTGHFE